jgi:predicted AlkP superfamily pyrophosphatase or phosphodiesterase
MFIVTGDHGMTNGGSHGGGTQEELTPALFFRYKGRGSLNNRFATLLKTSLQELKMKEQFNSYTTNFFDQSSYLRPVA